MTNPFQYGSSGFTGNSFTHNGQPTRRTSYANIVSGSPAQSRPIRPGTVSHLLNPLSPDNDLPGLYNTSSRNHPDATMTNPGDESLPWATGQTPRYGVHSRVFDIYTSKDSTATAGVAGISDEDGSSTALPNLSHTGFLSPSYLRGTDYLQKLEEAHQARVQAEREGQAAKAHPAGTPFPGVSGGAGGMIGLGGSHPHHHHLLQHHSPKLPFSSSHRGVSFELVEKPPSSHGHSHHGHAGVEDGEDVGKGGPLNPLPSGWNKDDKDVALEVIGEGYEVSLKHQGGRSNDHEACAIRADHYMPPQCGVYYFEVTVLNKRREDTTIGIGFSTKKMSLQRAPGWEAESWGYHGDDGHCFTAHSSGKAYGPKFGPGDTVGCLVNFRLGHALFTKNGDDLGIAFRDVNFKDVNGKLFPTVGLKKPGDHILANFGQVPFQFDIDGYMKKQQQMILENINKADTSKLAPRLNETELVQQLVLQFLQHDGYVETAKAFAEEIMAEKQALSLDQTKGGSRSDSNRLNSMSIKDDEDANNRQRIRRCILEGDIDQALKYTNAYYPKVLEDNEQVYFRLRCRKFIEMIRKEAELNLLLEKKGFAQKKGGFSNHHHQPSYGDGDDYKEAMMVDTEEEFGPGGDGEAAAAAAAGGVSKLSQEALAYGIELRAEFKEDPRREVHKHLHEIFALIAYQNPLEVKEVAHLLDRKGRVAVAEELNSAILMSLGKSSRAAMENLYAQTCVLLEDLRQDGGDGAFVTVQGVIDDIPKVSIL